LIASNEYSTWKSRPSGEKVLRCGTDVSQLSIARFIQWSLLDPSVWWTWVSMTASFVVRDGSSPYSDRAMNIVSVKTRGGDQKTGGKEARNPNNELSSTWDIERRIV
jgi:hypothetical protein